MIDRSRNEYHRIYMANRYKEFMREALDFLGNKCVDCGVNENLEFDHTNPSTKEFQISSGSKYSKEKFFKEVKKCELRCNKCHIEKSKKDVCEMRTGYREMPHGTYWKYKKYLCRCGQCTDAYVQKSREYNRKSKLKKQGGLV